MQASSLGQFFNRRFAVSGAAALVVLALAVPIAAAGQPADIKLASATDGRTLKLGDVTNDDNLVAVVYQERNLSYARWSKNYGQSFSPKAALRNGLRAKDPRVAACSDLFYAVSSWQTATSRNVGVDYRDVVTGENGRYSLGPGEMADVACYGEVAAVTWVHNGHLWLAAHERGCTNTCSPTVKMDLGTGYFDSPPRITADYSGFAVTWLTSGLAIQHFTYVLEGGGPFTLAPEPVLTLMAGKDVRAPAIAGLGERTVVAYARDGQTHVRLSADASASFGPRIIVSNYCRNCPYGGSEPLSVAVRGDVILVEILRGDGRATPPALNAFGRVSTDNGSHWTSTTGHTGGSQMGVSLTSSTIAEVWDAHFYNGFPYPETEQVIGYHVHNL